MRVKIYQINTGRDVDSKKFLNLKDGSIPDPSTYDEVFNAEIQEDTLEAIYTRFNTEYHPLFRGHSLSVSDVVDMNGKTYCCQSVGFVEVPFDESKTMKLDNLMRVVYEWEATFRKAFENDPNIGEIKYDCEAGGFFCYSKNLSTLADFGSRFKILIDDTEEFTKVVSEGIKVEEQRQKEFDEIKNKVKGHLISHKESHFNIRTIYGDIHLTPGDIQDIMEGSAERITVGDTIMSLNDFLMQDASKIQTDFFNPNTFQLITNDAFEQLEKQSMLETQTAQEFQMM